MQIRSTKKFVINYPDGDGRRYYRGEVKNGKCQGKGYLVYVNSEIYKGYFKNDKPNGRGVKYCIDGGKYVGEWRNGFPDGKGVYYKKN